MKTFPWLLLWIATFGLLGNAYAEQPIVIKFSHVLSSEAAKGKAADYFKKLAEERTGRRVRVDVYPRGELYTDNEELHALRSGEVQMLAPSVSKFAPLGLPEFEVFDIPYLIDSDEAWGKATEGMVGRKLLEQLKDKGVIGLGYWRGGIKHMSANKPLRRPEDARGLKMRIQPSKVLDMQMRALGAIPHATTFSNVIEALHAKVVDGTENPATTFAASRFDRVQKYLTLTGHGYLGYAVIVSKRFWDGLPDDIRDALESAVTDAGRYQAGLLSKADRQSLETVSRRGEAQVISLNAEEKAAWHAALNGVAREAEARVGRDNIVALRKELGIE